MFVGDADAALPLPGAANGRAAVWSDYVAVYHGNSLVNAASATGIGDLTAVGSPSLNQSPGVTGGRFQTSGNNYYEAVGFNPLLGPGDKTLSAAYQNQNPNTSGRAGLLHTGTNSTGKRLSVEFRYDTDTVLFGVANGSIQTPLVADIGRVAFTYDASEATNALAFVDGAQVAADVLPTIDVLAGDNLRIGRDRGTQDFVGFLSEIRLRASTLSPDWIATEHANVSNPGTFAAASDLQAVGGTPTPSPTPTPTPTEHWFDLTVGNLVVGGPHTDFAVLVTEEWLTPAQRADLFATARSDGANIRFSSDNTGNTEYPFELIAWDAVGETFAARVKPPAVAIGTQFTLRIVDGVTALPAPGDANGRIAVWPDYDAVYHGNSLINSASATGVGDLTAVGSPLLDQSPVASIGRFRPSPGADNGNYFEAAGFYPLLGAGDKTVLATLDIEAGTDQGVMHWGRNVATGSRFTFITDGANAPIIGFNGGAVSGTSALGTGVVSAAFVHDASEAPNAVIYLNGVSDGTATVTIDTIADGDGLRIGRDNAADNFDGFLSDIRFRNVAVSADWLATEHANRANIAAFGSSGDMQSSAAGAVNVIAEDLASAAVLDAATLSGIYVLDPAPLVSAAALDDVVIGQTDVFLVIGQSNAIGRAPFDNLGAHPSGTQQYSNNAATQDTVIAATVPLEHAGRVPGDMGPDVSFAEDYAALNTGNTLLFMPNAVGGTGLGDPNARWAVASADLYSETVTRANELLALDPRYVLRGIIIQIGERDTNQNTAAATFEALLDELITALRANITGAADVRVSVGPMLPAYVSAQPNGPAIEAVLADTPNRLANTVYVSPAGLNLQGVDSVHFDAPSLRALGSAHLDNFEALLSAPGDDPINVIAQDLISAAALDQASLSVEGLLDLASLETAAALDDVTVVFDSVLNSTFRILEVSK